MVKKRSIPNPTRVPQVDHGPKVIVHPSVMTDRVEAVGDEPFLRLMAPSKMLVTKGSVFVEDGKADLLLEVWIEPLSGPIRRIDGVELKDENNVILNEPIELAEGDRVSVILDQDAVIWYSFVYRIG